MSPDDDTPIYRLLADEQLFDLDLVGTFRSEVPGEPIRAGILTAEITISPRPAERPANIPADIPPPDEHDAGAGAHLGSVTDVEWFTAHHTLMRDVPELAPELDYIWDPSTDGRGLVAGDERDIAHRAGRYDPNTDERFHGGGYSSGQ